MGLFSSSSSSSRWNILKSPPKPSFSNPVLPSSSKKGTWPLNLLASKQPSWPQKILKTTLTLLKSLGSGGALALLLVPLLALLAFAAFTKFVQKRPLKSAFSSALDKLKLRKPSLPKPHLPNGSGLHLPNGSGLHLSNLANKLGTGKLGSHLPNGHLLGGGLPKGHFLSDRLPKPKLFGFLKLPWYLRWLNPAAALKKALSTLVFKVLNLHKVPGLRDVVAWFMKPKGFVPKGTLATLSSLRGIRPGLLARLNPFNSKLWNRKALAQQEDDEKFQAGEPYGDPDVVSTGLVEDLRTIGLSTATKDLKTLIETFKAKGKPQNDREMLVRFSSAWLPMGVVTDVDADGEDDRAHGLATADLVHAQEAVGRPH